MRGPVIRSAGGKLSIDGTELPGRCEEYSVEEGSAMPFVRVRVTLMIARTKAAPAPFKYDGREHYCDVSSTGVTTPSGKRACQVCGEAWPCSTELHRRRV